MFDRLAAVEEKYRELETMLGDPSVARDVNKLKKYSQELSRLRPIVEAIHKHRELQAQLDEARAMLQEEEDEELRELARHEFQDLREQMGNLETDLKIMLLPPDPNDEKNVILEIRAGTGGEEAGLFAADLLRMYLRYGERRRWKVELLNTHYGNAGGLKEVICSIEGDKVYSNLKFEGGVHRVQRVPETEAQGRIHTSAVTVAVLPEAEEVDVKIEEKDLRIDVFRSSGPGGQSVNTTDSAVRVTHLPTGLVVTCQDEKSQHKNKAQALKVLRSRLLEMRTEEQEAETLSNRRSMVGSGDRSEKIRTYNFPQNRLTDHRIGLTVHRLDSIMDGDLDEVISALIAHYHAEALKVDNGN